jgi:hypothetical protein
MNLFHMAARLVQVASRLSDLKLKYPKFENELEEISRIDPKGKYLEWSVKQLIKGHNLPDIKGSIEFFDKNNDRFKKKDINQYKDLKDLENEIKNLPKSKSQEKKKIKSSGSTKIYEDDQYALIRVDDKQACVEYGKGTKWCITMEDASYFEEYAEQNTLFYFLINKTDDDKIAIRVIRDLQNNFKGFDFYDAEDNQMTESEVPKKFVQLSKQDALKQSKTKYAPIEYRNEKGELSREDGPAVIKYNGFKAWYLNGELHRTDGPAIEWANGSKDWYLNNKRHRTDGPAVENADGYKAWYLNDQLHRVDGPAIEYANGDKRKFWWLNDKLLDPKEAINDPELKLRYPKLIQSMKDAGY